MLKTFVESVSLSLRTTKSSYNINNESHLIGFVLGEVAKLFADAGIICIASLISPYRRDRDACRTLLPEGDFVEVL